MNTHSDWRGRIYTHSVFISYQESDLSTSLLLFNDGEPLNDNGLFYLYIYGANAYNEDNISKEPFSKRVEWVKNNMQNILDMKKDFMLQADNKFVFAAFCLVIRNLEKDFNYKVSLFIFLDATVFNLSCDAATLILCFQKKLILSIISSEIYYISL